LIKILCNDTSRVQFPTREKIEMYKRIIHRRHMALKNIYCVGDGLKLRLQATKDEKKQSRYYNGWTHDHYITNLFLFSPDGLIIACVINAPGSLHDSTLCDWGNIYEKLEDVYKDTNGQCCMDSAFAAVNNPAIVRSSKNITHAHSPEEIVIFQQATKLRQAAEWGMRAIQSAFPRMRCTLTYEEQGSRKIILYAMVMLYNFRCQNVGLNQIRTVFVPEWNKSFDSVI
jgi:DDE superfamily endonuclease